MKDEIIIFSLKLKLNDIVVETNKELPRCTMYPNIDKVINLLCRIYGQK